jgi:hypothetical protein
MIVLEKDYQKMRALKFLWIALSEQPRELGFCSIFQDIEERVLSSRIFLCNVQSQII